jgi:hypothetical protein
LAGRLGWCVGLSLAVSGGLGLVLSILIALFSLASTRNIVGENPSAQLASLVMSIIYVLLGGVLVWVLWRWRPFAPQVKPTAEVVAEKWEEVTRWGFQWLQGSVIVLVIFVFFLPFVMTMPEWLAMEPGRSATWTHIFVAVAIGLIWASVYHIWRKARAKRDQAIA